MLSVWIFTAPTSTSQWWDVSGSLVSVSVSTHERGYLECILSLNVDGQLAKSILAAGGTPWVEVSDNGAPVWSGRIERTGRVDGTVTLFARGAYSAFTDVRYVGSFASSNLGEFKQGERNLDTSWRPEFYDLRTSADGVLISPKRGETHGGSTNTGVMYYKAPNGGGTYNHVHTVTFDYTCIAAAGWVFLLASYVYNASAPLSFGAVDWSLGATGAVQTGSATVTISASKDVIGFGMYSTNAPAALAVDTGTYNFRITNVRINFQSSSPTQQTVGTSVVSFVNVYNANQVSSTNVLIEASQPITQGSYQSADIQDVLADAASVGDASGNAIEYGVWDDRALFFRTRGLYPRTWYTDETGFEVERGMEDVRNYVGPIYTDSFGNNIVAVVAQDLLSQSHWGIIRSALPESGQNNSTDANRYRDAYIEQSASIVPSARGALRSVVDINGISFPLSAVRAGDILAIRSLEYGDSIDTINQFVISRTRYAAVVGSESLTIELQSPTASSAAFIAGAANRTTVARPPI